MNGLILQRSGCPLRIRAMRSMTVAAILGAGLLAAVPAVSAAPTAPMLARPVAVAEHVEQVRYYGRGGYGRGFGIGGGLVAGAIIGGALAAPYYYRPYYGPPPGYYAAPAYAPPVYAPAPAYGPPGDAVDYCLRRFRSYDPRSGTYMGYDGYRHSCP